MPRARLGSFAFALLLAAMARDAAPQVSLLTCADAAGITDLPMTCAGVGDVDADGFADVVIGRPIEREARGSLALLSSRTGRERWRIDGASFAQTLGRAVAGGADLDGDGIGDVAAVEFQIVPAVGYIVRAHSGATGAPLWSVLDGSSNIAAVCFVGDVDGDGASELLCGSPFATGSAGPAGRASLRSGRTGALLRLFEGTAALEFFGQSLAALGDVDGDGTADFAIAAPMAAPQGSTGGGAGYVALFSGRSGQLLRRFDGPVAGSGFGLGLAALADLDRDGTIDLAVGAPLEPNGGAAYFVSGASGALLRRLGGSAAGQQLGFALARLGDLDGDGLAECAIAAPGESGAGAVRIHDGASGAIRSTLRGSAGSRFGASLAPAADANGDGAEELWVLRDPASPLVGALTLFALRSLVPFGAGCRALALAPALALQPLRLGATAQIAGSGAPPFASGCLMVGLVPALPLGLTEACALYLEPATIFERRELASDASGAFALSIAVPLDPWLAGISIAAQAAWAEPSSALGFALTQAIYGTIEA
ncbi:MAG: FG-GAP repeat protein [Planctomycetes bacterium]|nr:FG-GAP repeat protein [Planctomycetota bacterium]